VLADSKIAAQGLALILVTLLEGPRPSSMTVASLGTPKC
jgi:hypothetical protein